MGKLTISMAIFNSYVSSPEGSKCSTVDSGETLLATRSFAPQGWGAQIADAYQRRADVLNRGYSGRSGRNQRWWNDGKAMGKAMGIFMI